MSSYRLKVRNSRQMLQQGCLRGIEEMKVTAAAFSNGNSSEAQRSMLSISFPEWYPNSVITSLLNIRLTTCYYPKPFYQVLAAYPTEGGMHPHDPYCEHLLRSIDTQ